MTLFTTTLPWASVLRVWDMFYFEGVNLFYRIGLAIMECSQDYILKECPTSSKILEFLLHIPHEFLTPDLLLEAAFKIKVKNRVRKLTKKIEAMEREKDNINNLEFVNGTVDINNANGAVNNSNGNNNDNSNIDGGIINNIGTKSNFNNNKILSKKKSKNEKLKINGVEFKLVGEGGQ